MLISRSYFVNDLLIANSQDNYPNSNLIGNKVKLDSFIEKYEREILLSVFGYEFYKELQSNLTIPDGEIEQVVKDDAVQKWKDLVNGCEVAISGRLYKFDGIKPIGTFIADYVYYKFMVDDLKNHSGVGFNHSKPDGAEKTNPTQKLVSVWNEMVSKIVNSDYFSTLSLYEYLSNKSADFPKWEGVNFEYKNQLGL